MTGLKTTYLPDSSYSYQHIGGLIVSEIKDATIELIKVVFEIAPLTSFSYIIPDTNDRVEHRLTIYKPSDYVSYYANGRPVFSVYTLPSGEFQVMSIQPTINEVKAIIVHILSHLKGLLNELFKEVH